MNKTALSGNCGVTTLRRSHRFQAVVFALLTPGLLVWNQPLQANPHGGVVVHGDVQIGAGAGGNLQILQNSQNAIIDWQGFSISAGELTQFLQPGSSSAVLNRVTGGDPSAIHGALQANGNVFLINPSGILVGPSGSIDVHGLVLSTLDVDNGEFLARGDMVFKGGSDKGVTNLGRISAIGGDVFLIGRTITNSGTVKASQGRVGLAAGEEVLLKADTGLEGERVFVRAKGAGASGPGILNDGTIEGAAVELKAHGNLYALAINNKGSVRATGAENAGGRVFLRGVGGGVSNEGLIETGMSSDSVGRVLIEAAYAKVDGQIKAEGGTVRIAATEKAELGGSIDVSAPSTGGSVVVESREIAVGSTAMIDASGPTGGGSIQIGGGFQGRDASIANAETLIIEDGATIRADALASGNGGQIILWSDGDTTFRGSVSAQALGGSGNGGFVEVSGKEGLLYGGTVSTLAASGQSGTLLLDPTNFTITAGSGASAANSIGDVTLEGMLAGGNVVITTASAGADAGDVTVNAGANVNWNSANSLTLLAHRHIRVGASIQNQGSGAVHLVAGWDGTGLTPAPGGSGVTAGAFDLSYFQGTPAAYGNNGGSVFVGDGTQTNGVSVGSMLGLTFVAGHDVTLTGSNSGSSSFAQIGYSGAGNVSGDIQVNARNRVSLQAGSRYDLAHAQIGHGGYQVAGDKGGDIVVVAGNGVTLTADQAGTGRFAGAQIGHGGRGHSAGNNLSGSITVEGGASSVDLVGGQVLVNASWEFRYAQIGHGGSHDAWGDFGGDIRVTGANVSLDGGATGTSYARIGHGGWTSGVNTGNRTGNIYVGTPGEVSIEIPAGGVAAIGHHKNAGAGTIHDANVTIVAASMDMVAGGSGGNLFEVGGAIGNMLRDNLLGGDVSLYATGAGGLLINPNAGIAYTSANGFNLLSAYGVDIRRTIQNAGSGSINVVAGWDPAVAALANPATGIIAGVDMAAIFGAPASYGKNNATVTLSGAAAAAAVGSLSGQTNVAGYAVSLSGGAVSGYYAQIGYRGAGTGAVTVHAKDGGVSLAAGTGGNAYAQIGHGGNSVAGAKSGNIEVISSNGVSLVGGLGLVSGAYAQIGHGGNSSTGNVGVSDGSVQSNIVVRGGSGAIELRGGGASGGTSWLQNDYAKIGHGGDAALIESHGNIDVSGNGVTLEAGGYGGVVPTTEGSRFASAQIGHGGRESKGGSGNIAVDAGTGNVRMIAGAAGENYNSVQIGHGGNYQTQGNIKGDIRVTGNHIDLVGGGRSQSFARIGHGGGDAGADNGNRSGSIFVRATGELSVVGGTGVAQIGHNTKNGGILLNADVTIQANSLDATYGDAPGNVFEIGNAFAANMAANLAGGDVSLHATGTGGMVVMSGANLSYTSANDFNLLSEYGVDIQRAIQNADSGNVNVVAGWDSVVAALANPLTDIIAGVDMHTGIFGVAGSFGKNNGSVTISNATGAAAVGSRFGETNVAAYDVTLTGTSGGLAQIGYFGAGDGDGDIRVKALDKVSLQAGDKYDQAHAQIGHGGYQVVGNKGGDITVEAGNGVTLTADQVGTGRFGGAQIGHGGRGATSQPNNYEGAITVDGGAGPVDLVAGLTSGSQDFRYAQIGHGGPYYAWGNFEGDIRVTGSDVNLASGARTYNYARIGHGGWTGEVNTGDRIGDIYVGTPGEISIQASPGGGVAVIGHHKNAGAGTIHDANVTIEAASMDHVFGGSGGDVFEVGSAFAAMMMANLVGGDISLHATGAGGLLVNSGGSMVFTSANDFNFLSEHDVRFQGSVQNRGDGNINVVAGWDPAKAPLADPATGIIADVDLAGDLLGVAGSYGNHYAAVVVDSSSGPVAVGSARGATTVVGHAVEVLGSDTAGGGYAQIGAAPTAGVSPTGAIAVLAKEGGVNVKGGGAASAYAQIGHRSLGATIPALSGGILVDSLGGLVLSGGAGLLSSAQIGHGGNSGDVGSIGGAVTVNVADDIDVIGGSGSGAYAQIGHGGLFTKGSMADDIEVNAGGDILLSASDPGFFAYAKIGHGDDVRGGGGGTGDRDGDIVLTAGGDIELESALVGHVNGSGSATAAGGKTWIGAARSAPGDPAAGKLVADAASEFSGFEEVRFYLPRRANNGVAAGAKINGEIYDGGVADPQLGLRPDEYTNYTLCEDGTLDNSLSHHDNTLGSGPAPDVAQVAGRYAFYYDQTEIGTPPVVVVPGGPGAGGNSGNGGGSVGGGGKTPAALDYRRLLPDDRTRDKWLRDQEREYSRWGGYGVYYEGYPQYGPHGESVYQWGRR